MKTDNIPPHLLLVARAIQCAAKHYEIDPQRILHPERMCAIVCHARWAIWTALNKYHGWRLIDIAAEFRMSASGVGIGIQKGTLLMIESDWNYIECVEKLKIHTKK